MLCNKAQSAMLAVVTGLAVLAGVVIGDLQSFAAAAQDKPGDKGKAKAEEKVTLTGAVSKKDDVRKTDDGKGRVVTLYFLTEKNGNKISLPPPRKNEAGKPLDKYDLEDFVGREVVVTGRAVLAKESERPDAPLRVTELLSITEIKEKK